MGYSPSRQLCDKHETENNLSRTFGTLQNNFLMFGIMGAFLLDDPDQDQRSKITWVTDPDPDHLKGTLPICNVRALSKSQNFPAGT